MSRSRCLPRSPDRRCTDVSQHLEQIAQRLPGSHPGLGPRAGVVRGRRFRREHTNDDCAFGSLAPLFRFLGDPYQIQTPEGFITWRIMELFVPLAISFWPILAGARLVRGEEERGSMDVLLATAAVTHAPAALEDGCALDRADPDRAALCAGSVAGEARLEGHADVVRALLAGLNLSLLAFFFGMSRAAVLAIHDQPCRVSRLGQRPAAALRAPG